MYRGYYGPQVRYSCNLKNFQRFGFEIYLIEFNYFNQYFSKYLYVLWFPMKGFMRLKNFLPLRPAGY